MSAFILNKLHNVTVKALEYVHADSPHVPSCFSVALKALDAAFEAAHDGRAADIVFKLETTECPSPTP